MVTLATVAAVLLLGYASFGAQEPSSCLHNENGVCDSLLVDTGSAAGQSAHADSTPASTTVPAGSSFGGESASASSTASSLIEHAAAAVPDDPPDAGDIDRNSITGSSHDHGTADSSFGTADSSFTDPAATIVSEQPHSQNSVTTSSATLPEGGAFGAQETAAAPVPHPAAAEAVMGQSVPPGLADGTAARDTFDSSSSAAAAAAVLDQASLAALQQQALAGFLSLEEQLAHSQAAVAALTASVHQQALLIDALRRNLPHAAGGTDAEASSLASPDRRRPSLPADTAASAGGEPVFDDVMAAADVAPEERPTSTPLRGTPVQHMQQPSTPGGVQYGSADAAIGSELSHVAAPSPHQRTIVRSRKTWGQHFGLLAAVRTEGDVTALAMMAEHPVTGRSPYLVLGDSLGRLYVFSHRGDLLYEYKTGSSSPITALTGYYVRRNESVLVGGHKDGEIRTHFATELHASDPDEPPLIQAVHLRHVLPPGAGRPQPPARKSRGASHRTAQPPTKNPAASTASATSSAAGDAPSPASGVEGAVEESEDEQSLVGKKADMAARDGVTNAPEAATLGAAQGLDGGTSEASVAGGSGGMGAAMAPPITLLQHFKVRGQVGNRRHIVSLDLAGRLRVQSAGGEVRSDHLTRRPHPLAVQITSNMVVVLAQGGFSVTSINFKNKNAKATEMNQKPRTGECRGLNGSTLVAAAFDASRNHRAFGLTSTGELVSLQVPHQAHVLLCRVSQSRPLQLPAGEVRLASLGSYLLLTHPLGVAVFNVSNALKYSTPRVLAETSLGIVELLGESSGSYQPTSRPMLIATTGRSQRVAMTLGGAGLVTLWQSDLPGPTLPPPGAKNWLQPMFIVAISLTIGYQMWRKTSGAGGFGGNRPDAMATTYREALRKATQSPLFSPPGASSSRSRYGLEGTGNGRVHRLGRR